MNSPQAISQISFECEIPRSALTLLKEEPEKLWFLVELEDTFILAYDSDGFIDIWDKRSAL